MTATMRPTSATAVFRHRSRADLGGGLVLWAGFLLFVLMVTAIVSGFRPVAVSGWDVASQLPRWYVGAFGVYLTAVYLPLYVAHGISRRRFAVQAAPLAVVFALVYGALMALGYLIERFVYRMFGWTQALTQAHLFDAPTQFGTIMLEFAAVFAVWIAAGGLVGAAFYRDPGLGILSIPVGLAMLGVIESATGPDMFAFVGWLLAGLGISIEQATPTGAAMIAPVLVAVGFALTWALVRDVPMRNREA